MRRVFVIISEGGGVEFPMLVFLFLHCVPMMGDCIRSNFSSIRLHIFLTIIGGHCNSIMETRHTNTHTHSHSHTPTHPHVYTHAHTYTHTHTHTHRHTLTYTYTHKHTHKHTHTHTYTVRGQCRASPILGADLPFLNLPLSLTVEQHCTIFILLIV